MIRRFDDHESLSRAVADLFVSQSLEAVRDRGRFTVALSGGSTPRRTYQLLAEAPWRHRIPWDRIHLFWGDERCVGQNDQRSNAGMVQHELLDQVPVRPEQVHPIRCHEDPRAGAAHYEEMLRAMLPGGQPALDLILLGLGENGHTASLFPQSPVLDETKRWAAEVYLPEQDLYRVTLTPRIINAGRMVAFVVSGAEKGRILQSVLEGPRQYRNLPAQLIDPRPGKLLWMMDRAAAALLEGRNGQVY